MILSSGLSQVSSSEIDQRIHIFRRDFHEIAASSEMTVDAYIICTERYAIVFDTFFSPEDAKIMIETMQPELAQRQLLVVNSHTDWDHAWGNAFFTGIQATPIIAHTHARTRLQSSEMQEELAEFQGKHPIFHTVELVPPTLTFEHNLTIYGGDLSIELFAALGHQPDHIAAWIPELQLLLAFDAIESPLPGIHTPESVVPMLNTLEHFLQLNPRHVLCSHSTQATPELIHANLTYLHEIEHHCRDYLKQNPLPQLDSETQLTDLIGYPFEDVTKIVGPIQDQAYYEKSHEQNVQCILEWLTGAYSIQ